jgi:hypothetical protein
MIQFTKYSVEHKDEELKIKTLEFLRPKYP